MSWDAPMKAIQNVIERQWDEIAKLKAEIQALKAQQVKLRPMSEFPRVEGKRYLFTYGTSGWHIDRFKPDDMSDHTGIVGDECLHLIDGFIELSDLPTTVEEATP